jgi:hypothetical protein
MKRDSSPAPIRRFPAVTFVCGGAYGTDLGFGRAGNKAKITVTGVMPHRDAYSDPTERERAAAICAELGLTESCNTSHREKDMTNANNSDVLIIFLQAQFNNELVKYELVPRTGGGAMKTFRYFLNGRYDLPDDCNADFAPTREPHLGGTCSGIDNRTAHYFHIVGGDLKTLRRYFLVQRLIEVLSSLSDGTRLMVSGPNEETLPGVAQAIEDLFTAVIRMINEDRSQ